MNSVRQQRCKYRKQINWDMNTRRHKYGRINFTQQSLFQRTIKRIHAEYILQYRDFGIIWFYTYFVTK